MNDYQKEQAESLRIIRQYLSPSKQREKENLLTMASEYFSFRKQVDSFLVHYFGHVCQLKCYQNRLSACCGKEGIVTFFADMVINALVSSEDDLDRIESVISNDMDTAFKCIYLGEQGCIWKIKPIICEMFLCDTAMKEVFEKDPSAKAKWNEFKIQEKRFRWPDQPVLFDQLEEIFLDAGYCTSLMYLHNSPGLLRIKQKAGLL